MNVRELILKTSVRSSSRDNSAFIIKEVCDYYNIPTTPVGENETKGGTHWK